MLGFFFWDNHNSKALKECLILFGLLQKISDYVA